MVAGGEVGQGQAVAQWKAHDLSRPRPRVMQAPEQALPVAPPADAIVLFDGKNLKEWRSSDGGAAKWVIQEGAIESVPGSGYLYSAQPFGDVQLHLEWAAPLPAKGEGQGRGNSGVFLMGLYEVQVLDSYQAETYADGQAAAIYGQYPPLVNVCRPPGEWQSYDIIFRRPRFRRDGALEERARITVIHNGVLVQDNVEIWGPTAWLQHYPYNPHPDKLPLGLQDHGNPVRYRNIWVRNIPESKEAGPAAVDSRPVISLPDGVLDRYVGKYQIQGEPETVYTVSKAKGRLQCQFHWNTNLIDLVPHSESEFSLRWTAGDMVFDARPGQRATGLRFKLGGDTKLGKRMD